MAGRKQPRLDLGKQILQEDAAALLGVSIPMLTMLAREHYIERPYTLGNVAQGYIRKLRENRAEQTKAARNDAVTIERARKLKMENDTNEGKLVPFDDVMHLLDLVYGEFRADVQSMPSRVTDDLDVRRKLDQECRQVLEALAGRFKQASANLVSPLEAGEAGEDDEAERVGFIEPEISSERGATGTA